MTEIKLKPCPFCRNRKNKNRGRKRGCQCSVCGDCHDPCSYYNYCPTCGAKMDEEVTP